MANLKDLKNRISSVKSTQKITSAMKMVAAAKLRRAQEAAEAARPYAERMERMLNSVAASAIGAPGSCPKTTSVFFFPDFIFISHLAPTLHFLVEADHGAGLLS